MNIHFNSERSSSIIESGGILVFNLVGNVYCVSRIPKESINYLEKENWMVKLAYINITPLWTAYIIIQVITPAVL